ncbi:MAG: glycosyltransferase family 87 protein [Archangium sp.]
MNHYIAGILKIALLEASVALLLIDVAAGEKYLTLRNRAHAVLTTLMVLAFCNYGALHPSNDPAMLLTAVPIVLLCGRAVAFAFDPKRQERFAAFRAAAAANPARTERGAFVILLVVVVMAWVWLHGLSFWPTAMAVAVAGIGARLVRRVASGELKIKESLTQSLLARAKPIAVGLVLVSSFGWVAGGVLSNRALLIHQWEQFHFYLGAKYQREVGWFNLYKAVIVADRESINTLAQLQTTRDLSTFETVSVEEAIREPQAIKSRFTPERWNEFKNDWVQMSNLWRIDWTRIINDHGNSNSPAWAIVAGPLTRMVPLTMEGQAFLGWLDMILMLGLWLVIWQTFGHRAASVGLIVWAAPPIIFEYSTGSILRWDWLFAVGLAACFLKQKRYGWAGGAFGFALATKLFPLFFGVALGLKAFLDWRKTKKLAPEHFAFARSTLVAGAVTVGISTLMFGVDSWKEYAQRIQVAQVEKFYAIQYSFKSVYLQHAASPMTEWAQTIFPGALKQQANNVETCKGSASSFDGNSCSIELSKCGDNKSFTLACNGEACTCSVSAKQVDQFTEPGACNRAKDLFRDRCKFPTDYSGGLFIAQLLFTLVILVLIRRADDVEAFLLGPLLVFTWLTVNMYYWNMLGLMAVGLVMRSERKNQKPALFLAIGFHLAFMIYYVYQHLNRNISEGYAVAWIFTALITIAAIWEALAARGGDAAPEEAAAVSSSASPPPAR